jgi:rsbT co-antagonist protein RsbR
VARHLIKTVSAARLMGADCIISGICPHRPVHLGLQLDVASKATMADAFALALQRTEQVIGRSATKSLADAGHEPLATCGSRDRWTCQVVEHDDLA